MDCERPDKPDWGFRPYVTEDGLYLTITAWRDSGRGDCVYYKDLTEPYGMPIHLVGDFDHQNTCVGNDGAVMYFMTNFEAPNSKVIAIDTFSSFATPPGIYRYDVATGESTLLRRAQAGDGKVLSRIETRAGHGGGKPASKIIEEVADGFAFALANTPGDSD